MMWISKQEFLARFVTKKELERFVTKKEFNRFEKRIEKRIGRIEIGLIVVGLIPVIIAVIDWIQ